MEQAVKTRKKNTKWELYILNHIKPLRTHCHDATPIRDPLCCLQKGWYFWVADGNSLKNGTLKSQHVEPCQCSSSPDGDHKPKDEARKKEAVKYFCQFLLMVNKAEGCLNSFVDFYRQAQKWPRLCWLTLVGNTSLGSVHQIYKYSVSLEHWE